MEKKQIRNFSIVAHIDHGKSTLADRLLELTKTIDQRRMQEQVLDTMDLERERGITIKAQAIRMQYRGYELNLIDTPGHVDFNYEVSRSLAACEGAVLVVDASPGIEAQTLANAHLAQQAKLELIGVLNKIDLPSAEPKKYAEEMSQLFKIAPENIILASAKEGKGIKEILERIIAVVPPPTGKVDAPLQALIFDSNYDSYRGVIAYIRVVNGSIKKGQKIRMMGTGREYEVLEIGYLKLDFIPQDELSAGEVGYLIANIKEIKNCHVGDTITDVTRPAARALPGYQQPKPMVFCGFYPVSGKDYENLKEAVEKLQLNDAALFYEPETSAALGFGLRCGFLGLLHLEIIQERLEREFKINLIATAPTVVYKINRFHKKPIFIDSPAALPPAVEVESIEEPFFKVVIFTPSDYVGSVMELCTKKRAVFLNLEYLDPQKVMLTYEMPLAEVIVEFHDALKSATRGFASMDYELAGYRAADLVKLDILLNNEPVDALSTIVPRENAPYRGRELCLRLKEVIPRHQFEIPIQAAIGSKVVARETLSAMRKNVLAKCYGGDVTRKRKLLEKQKEGKKRMKRIGQVDVPQEAFLAVLKIK